MLTFEGRTEIALRAVDIEASARKHGVPGDDMLHALRNHWRAFETDDPAVTMYIGPASLESRLRWASSMTTEEAP